MLRTTLPEHRLSKAQQNQIRAFCKGRLQVDFCPKRDHSTDTVIKSGCEGHVPLNEISRLAKSRESLDFQDILDELRSDMNIPLLFDRPVGLFRSLRPGGTWSNHDRYLYVTAFAWASYRNQLIDPIDFKLYASTPHGLGNYVEARVLELLGARVFIIGRSIVSGYAKLYEGIGRDRKMLRLDTLTDKQKVEYKNAVGSKIRTFKGNYSKAIPWYEKIRAERLKGRVFSLGHTFWTNRRNPRGALNSWNCWRLLERLTKKNDRLPEKYVVFFLQFQPERTSLPESWGFTQQYDAIHIVRRCLPEDVQVLVREHPSTFRNRCDERTRSPKFYTAIDKLSGVGFADIHMDPYNLIDESKAVVTLTGTVGAEALARGVPAVFLGTSMISDCKGLHHYQDEQSLRAYFKDLLENSPDKSELSTSSAEALVSDLDSVYRVSQCLGSCNDLTVVSDALRALLTSGEVC